MHSRKKPGKPSALWRGWAWWGKDWLVYMLGAAALLAAFGAREPLAALGFCSCAILQAALSGRVGLATPKWRAFGQWFALGAVIAALLWLWIGAMLGLTMTQRMSMVVAFAGALLPTGHVVYLTWMNRHTRGRLLDQRIVVRHAQVMQALATAQVLVLDAPGVLLTQKPVAQAVAAPLKIVSPAHVAREPAFLMLMLAALFCQQGEPDATDRALLEFGARMNFRLDALLGQYPRVHMRTQPWPVSTHQDRKTLRVFARGSVEELLPCCSMIFEGRARKMEEADREAIRGQAAAMGRYAHTVIAFATGQAEAPRQSLPPLAFVGLIALAHPLKPEAPILLDSLRDIGVTPVLATSLAAEETAALTGLFEEGCAHVNLSPGQKAQVVRGWQAEGYQIMALGASEADLPMMDAADAALWLGGVNDANAAKAEVILSHDQVLHLPEILEVAYEDARIRKKAWRALWPLQALWVAVVALLVGLGWYRTWMGALLPWLQVALASCVAGISIWKRRKEAAKWS